MKEVVPREWERKIGERDNAFISQRGRCSVGVDKLMMVAPKTSPTSQT